MLGDIATLTGGTLISEDLGIQLEKVDARAILERPRRSPSTKATPRSSKEVEPAKTSKPASTRSVVKSSSPTATTTRKSFKNVLAKLTGGVAVVSVGAETEADMKQKKARVEDALHATRAAIEEGILPGGGVALLRCMEAVAASRKGAKGDEKVGVDIVLAALDAPIRQIASNGGIDGSVVADIVAGKATNTGYNAFTGEYTDMLKAGVIDPVKVVRTALANAASIAGLLLTTDAMVSTFDDDDKNKRRVEGVVA